MFTSEEIDRFQLTTRGNHLCLPSQLGLISPQQLRLFTQAFEAARQVHRLSHSVQCTAGQHGTGGKTVQDALLKICHAALVA